MYAYFLSTDLLPDPFDSFGSLNAFMEDTEAQTRGEISPKGKASNWNDLEWLEHD